MIEKYLYFYFNFICCSELLVNTNYPFGYVEYDNNLLLMYVYVNEMF